MKTIVAAAVLLGVAVVLMGVKVLFVKGGKFPSGHAHDLEARRREAIARIKKK